MTDNIVASVSRFLTPELIGKLTSAANLERNVGQRAKAAIVPAILSGLAGVAGTPAGQRQLANVVAQQPSDMLGNARGSRVNRLRRRGCHSLPPAAPMTKLRGLRTGGSGNETFLRPR
jgi:hypothetical protein